GVRRVPGSDLTAYRSYCITALLIRHKLPKEAVVEFQSRFFVDCGGNPLTNLYSDLQHLRKKRSSINTGICHKNRGAAVDETPSSESPSTSTGPASLPTPPVTVDIQWDRFLEVFPSSLHSVAPSKRLCVGAGFTAYRPLYRKWRNVQLLERTSYILSQAMGRHATQPTEEAVRRSLTKERWVSNTPSVQDVVRGWVAPLGAPTSSQSLIRSISEQSWRGLAVRDFGGERAKELCIFASSRCDCHPEVETYGRLLNHSRKRPNLKPRRFDLTFPDGPRELLVFLALQNIKMGEELLWDYGVTRASFGGEGQESAWLDMWCPCCAPTLPPRCMTGCRERQGLTLLECYFCHVRAEATKGLTSGQGRFFVDCGVNPLTTSTRTSARERSE
ncbi:hypothetical protein KUCAC02_001036, partial [Chaenocephalus aceratus]